MGFEFANIGAMNGKVTLWSFFSIIAFVLFFDYLTEIVEYFLEENKMYGKMMELIYKELMLMGIVTFVVIMVEAGTEDEEEHGSEPEGEDWYVAIDFSHILLFYITIFFVVHALYFIRISRQSTQRYREYFAMESADIFATLRSIANSAIASFFYRNNLPFCRSIEFLEFRLAACLFKDVYVLPKDFNFPSYLSGCFNHFALKTINRSLFSWCFLFLIVLFNYFRTLAGFGCGIATDDAEEGDVHHDDDGEENGDSVWSVWKNDCAGRDVMEFAFAAVVLCLLAIMLLFLARHYKQKLLCRAGVYSPEEYEDYFKFRQTETIEGRTRNSGPTNIHVSTEFLIEAIEEEMDENEQEVVDEGGVRFVGELLRYTYKTLKFSFEEMILGLKTKVHKIFEMKSTGMQQHDAEVKEAKPKMGETSTMEEGGGIKVDAVVLSPVRPAPPKRLASGMARQMSFLLPTASFYAEQSKPGASETAESIVIEGTAQSPPARINLKKNSISGKVVDFVRQASGQITKTRPNSENSATAGQRGSLKSKSKSLFSDEFSSLTEQLVTVSEDDLESDDEVSPVQSSKVEVALTTTAASRRGIYAKDGSISKSRKNGPNIDPMVATATTTGSLQPHTSANALSELKSANGTLYFSTLTERFLELKGTENCMKAQKRQETWCFGFGRYLCQKSVPLAQQQQQQHQQQQQQQLSSDYLKEPNMHENLYNFENIFLFNSERLFRIMIETAILLNSLYLSLWLTNFVLIAAWDVEVSAGWHWTVNLLMISPFFIVFPVLGSVASTASLLFALKDINQEVLYEVLKETMETKELLENLRNRLLVQLQRKFDKTGQCRATPEQLKPMVARLFDEIDCDHSGYIDKTEFRILLRKLHVTYSDVRFGLLYRGVDISNAGGISIGELESFLFPGSSSTDERNLGF